MGTIISAVITGFSVHYLTKAIGFITTTIPILESMIFGALISSIDPVAVLSIMHSMGVCETDMIYVLVFGEAILNDGVSIAMFESLVMHLHGPDLDSSLDGALILSSARYFWKVSWISILVGVSTGVACTVYFWGLRGRHGQRSRQRARGCRFHHVTQLRRWRLPRHPAFCPRRIGSTAVRCSQATAPVSRSFAISESENPQSRSASSVCSPAWAGGRAISGSVRLKRGAGDGWTTPKLS